MASRRRAVIMANIYIIQLHVNMRSELIVCVCADYRPCATVPTAQTNTSQLAHIIRGCGQTIQFNAMALGACTKRMRVLVSLVHILQCFCSQAVRGAGGSEM